MFSSPSNHGWKWKPTICRYVSPPHPLLIPSLVEGGVTVKLSVVSVKCSGSCASLCPVTLANTWASSTPAEVTVSHQVSEGLPGFPLNHPFQRGCIFSSSLTKGQICVFRDENRPRKDELELQINLRYSCMNFFPYQQVRSYVPFSPD